MLEEITWKFLVPLPQKAHNFTARGMDLFAKPSESAVPLRPSSLARAMTQSFTPATLLAFERTYANQAAAVHALPLQYVLLVRQLVEALHVPDTLTSACRLLFWMLEVDPALPMALPLVHLASLVDTSAHAAHLLAAALMQPHVSVTTVLLEALPSPPTAATYTCLQTLAVKVEAADAFVGQPSVQRALRQNSVHAWRLFAAVVPKVSALDELPVEQLLTALHTSREPELLEAALRCFQALLCAFPLCMLIAVRSNPLPRLWGGSNPLRVCIAAAGAYAEWNKTSAEVCKPGKPMLPCVKETARVLCAFFASGPVAAEVNWQPACVLGFMTSTAAVWPEFPEMLFHARPHLLSAALEWCHGASSTMIADFIVSLGDAVPAQLYERPELYAYLLALMFSGVSLDAAPAALFYCMRKGAAAARVLVSVPDVFVQLLTVFERAENTPAMAKMLAAIVYTLARLHEVCPKEVARHVRTRPQTQHQCAILARKYRNDVMQKLCMALAVM